VVNTVATLGTALTAEHARLLKRRLGPDGVAVLCYDADQAGRRAAATGAGVLLEAGVEVSVLVLPAGKDPDDVVRELGVDAFREMLTAPSSLLEYLLAELPSEPASRRRAGLKLAPLVCSAADPAIRQNLIEELARQLYLRPSEIEEHGRRGSRASMPSKPPARRSLPPGERELARILLECDPEWRQRIIELVDQQFIRDRRVRLVLETARGLEFEGGASAFATALLESCPDQEVQGLVAELANSEMPPVSDDSIRQQLTTLLQRQSLEQSRQLEPLIAAAEKKGDHREVDRLLAEKAKLRVKSAEF
jgi:DNA primase